MPNSDAIKKEASPLQKIWNITGDIFMIALGIFAFVYIPPVSDRWGVLTLMMLGLVVTGTFLSILWKFANWRMEIEDRKKNS